MASRRRLRSSRRRRRDTSSRSSRGRVWRRSRVCRECRPRREEGLACVTNHYGPLVSPCAREESLSRNYIKRYPEPHQSLTRHRRKRTRTETRRPRAYICCPRPSQPSLSVLRTAPISSQKLLTTWSRSETSASGSGAVGSNDTGSGDAERERALTIPDGIRFLTSSGELPASREETGCWSGGDSTEGGGVECGEGSTAILPVPNLDGVRCAATPGTSALLASAMTTSTSSPSASLSLSSRSRSVPAGVTGIDKPSSTTTCSEGDLDAPL